MSHVAPLPSGLRSHARFVDREAQRAQLHRALDAVARGGTSLVLVSGEPGVGKSALVATFAAEAHAAGALVLYGRSDEDLAVPYQPFVEALRGALDGGALDGIGSVPGAGELLRLLPDLSHRVSGLSPPGPADPETERWALFEAMVRVLAALAAAAPIVLVVDDVQWAAEPTLLLLRHLLRAERSTRLLVIGTERDTHGGNAAQASLLSDLRLSERSERLPLTGLTQTEVAELVAVSAGHALEAPGFDLAAALHRETSGNPFFITEVLRHLVEIGAIYHDEGRWTSDRDVSEAGLPESVRAVVQARVDRLSDKARRVLGVAALVGQSFTARTLQLVPEATDDVDALLDALDEVVGSGLVMERGGAFEFTHAIVRHTLAESVGATRRARMHRSIGEAIEAQADDSGLHRTAALAWHFAEAAPLGEAERAARYAILASHEARRQAAHELAIDVLEHALRAIETNAGAGDVDARCRLLIELADTEGLLASQVSERVRAAVARAAAEARSSGSARMLATAVMVAGWYAGIAQDDPEHDRMIEDALSLLGPDDDEIRSELLAEKAFRLAAAGDFEQSLVLADQAAALAERSGTAWGLTRSLHARGAALLSTSRVEEVRAVGVELMQRADGRSAPYTRTFGLTYQATAALMTGDREQYDALHRAIGDLAKETRAWYSRYTDVAYRGNAALMDGRWDDALAADGALLELAGDDPNALNVWAVHQIAYHWDTGRMREFVPAVELTLEANPTVYGYRMAVAMAYGEVGRIDEARLVLDHLLADGYALPRDQTWPVACAVGIDAVARVGDRRSAAVLFEMLHGHRGLLLAQVGAMFNAGAADRYLGMAAAVLDRHDEAVELLLAAAALEDRARCRPQATRTRMWLGRSLLARADPGDVERARAVLERARTDASELEMATVLAEVTALEQSLPAGDRAR